MKAPAFWFKPKGFLAFTLWPFSVLYEIGGNIMRSKIAPVQLPIPVICVGNVVAGGAGKTPVALHIGKLLKAKGIKAFFLTRGYGGALPGPVLVNPKKHKAVHVGDEALLLAEILPTVKCANRVAGAKLALQKGAEVIIMDDGYQNPSLYKTLSVLVIDGSTVYGNGLLIPAGPLRERPRSAIARAHIIILVNRNTRTPAMPNEKAIYMATTRIHDGTLFKGKKIYLFCGIGNPDKFFGMMSVYGANIVATKAFPDHHPYTMAELNKLIIDSVKQKAVLVTTRKDLMRVPPELHDCMIAADLDLELDNEGSLSYVLDYVLGRVQPSSEEETQTDPAQGS